MRAYLLDIAVLAVIVLGIFCGITLQKIFIYLTPYVIVLVAVGQFLTFMPIRLISLFKMERRHLGEVALWSILKIAVLPMLLWPLAWQLSPNLAAGVVFTGGAATAVLAPMIAGVLHGNTVRVMQVVIVTSAIMPFSLPLLMDLGFGAHIEFDLWRMGLMLGLAVIIPSIAAILVRRYLPRLGALTLRVGPVAGRSTFFFTAAGLTAPYADLFTQDTGHVAYLMCIAAGAVVFACLAGFILAWLVGMPVITGVLCLGFGNFGLTAATASHFLGNDATIIAIGFMLPSMLPVPFMRLWAERRARSTLVSRT